MSKPTPLPSQRSRQILAKSIYRKLSDSGLSHKEQIAVATDLLALIAAELRDAS